MSSNTEIKSNLFTIYDKISKPNTKEVGYELYKKLITKNIHSQSNMNTIINNINDFLTALNPKEKEPHLKLLSLTFYTEDLFNKEIYYQYLSPVLSIIQVLIKDSNSSIFPQISETYANIVQNLMPTDIEATNDELEPNEKRAYELLQGFCIYNMKLDDKNNKILGSLCLTKLVENCPIVLKPNYLKFIWENLINFIDKKNFNAKHEILNCLISLILGAEDLFNPYANVTLYKVLDFLTENDWLKRKLALNIIYTLIVYCKEEILPLKEHIINFLKALKTDKVKEVREVCLLILQIFNENDDSKKKKNNVQATNVKRKKIKNANNDINNNSFNNINNNSIDLSNRDNNNNNNNIKKIKINNNNNINNNNINNKKKRENSKPSNIRNTKNENFFNNNKQFSDNNGIDVITVDFKKKNKQIENKRSKTPISNKNINNNNSNNNLNTSDVNNISYDNNTTSNFNNTKKNFVNRRADNTFVDEKMVIKRDPNKSISKAKPNMDFFKNVNKKQDIIVLAKGKNNFKYDDSNEENFVVTKKKDDNKNNNINVINNKDNNNDENDEKKENNLKNNESFGEVKNNDDNLINKKKGKNNSNFVNNENNNIQNDDNQLINSQNKENSYKNNNKNNNINNNYSKKNSNNNIKNNFNENKNNVNHNNIEFNYNNNINPNLINSLIEQMNSLSQKQIILIDTIDKIQSSTNDKINKLDNKIISLENNIESLNNKLNNIRSNNNNYNY